jgi:type I restriction enzyme S subunit
MKAWQGSVGVSRYEGIVSPDYLVCSVESDVDARYLHYLLRSLPLINEYRMRSKGIRPAQWRLYWEDMADIVVSIPDRYEQHRIGDFLDAETAAVDRFVKARHRQLGLIAERSQAALSYEYQQLAEKWGTVRLRRALRRIEQGWSPECEDRLAGPGEWGVVKAGCVNGGVFRPEEHKALPQDTRPKLEYLLRPGDLLVSRASGSLDLIGSVGIVADGTQGLLLCDKVYRIQLDRELLENSFVALMLQATSIREEIKLGVSGAGGLANNLPSSVVRNLPIPTPPRKVQQKASRAIRNLFVQHSNAAAALRRQLELLAERRQALVTATVAGQIDIATAQGVGAS